jgi:hypothetical protein
VSAYLFLAVDAYPPFSGADDPSYPVRVHVAPPLEHYSRLKVFFRLIYAYLAQVTVGALSYVVLFASFLSLTETYPLLSEPAAPANASPVHASGPAL